MLEADDGVLRDFIDALEELDDAAEFEALMLGADRPYKRERFRDFVARLEVHNAITLDATALDDLKGRLALERLQRRHPEVWERVNRQVVDA